MFSCYMYLAYLDYYYTIFNYNVNYYFTFN
nr:MAG TPA: hypothetical protein [Caudoviricetes sp.]